MNGAYLSECRLQAEKRRREWINKNPTEAYMLVQQKIDEMRNFNDGLVVKDILS
jgi:hypothetical protein